MIASLLALPVAVSASESGENLFEIIKAQKQLFGHYYNTEDLDGLIGLYTGDAVVIAPNYGPARGHHEIRAGLAEELALGDGTIELKTLEVVGLSPESAYEIGYYKLVIEMSEGAPIFDEGHYVVVWKLESDGIWRLHVDTWNTSLPLE